ncbi:lactate utilization protein, partial [Campylobacter jejuni]|nr:lactate utilization protein [Campylobacter jejuni]
AFWLIENEGNGRMCTTAPDIHIALCGIEKIMESFEDAATMVSLLTPSATGQFIPTYNNIITGPRKNGDLDGPKEVHVILFDHNRSKMLAHEDYYEALRCIRCGACMNFCPVYDQIGGHA